MLKTIKNKMPVMLKKFINLEGLKFLGVCLLKIKR